MIRFATHADIPRCVEMGRAFFAESNAASFPFDESSAEKTLTHLIEAEDGALLVAEKEGVVGMVGALAYPHFMNLSKKAAQELFWWVEPAHRGGSAGVRLLQAVEAWAEARGCATLTMVCLPIDSPAERIYQRTGYRALERSYVKGL